MFQIKVETSHSLIEKKNQLFLLDPDVIIFRLLSLKSSLQVIETSALSSLPNCVEN